MKLLLFSDVHCSKPAVERLIQKAKKADVLVGAGDFGTMRNGTAETLSPLKQVGKPIVLVPGNAESDDELRDAVAGWNVEAGHAPVHPLHGTGVEIDGVPFFGLGGGIPVTPFGAWSFDLDEEVAAVQLNASPKNGVLVVHSPPYGAVDVSSRGKHLGSQAIRETVLRCKPRLTVCGHIHDCAGRWEAIDGAMVVNAGPAGILWDLDACQPMDD